MKSAAGFAFVAGLLLCVGNRGAAQAQVAPPVALPDSSAVSAPIPDIVKPRPRPRATIPT